MRVKMNVSSYRHERARAGSQDERALDYVLRADERICTYLRMDPCPTRTGGLWYRRGPAVVSINSFSDFTQYLPV